MRYEQTVQVETSEYICLVKRIDGLVIQKSLVSELIRCKDCKYYRDGDCWHEWDNDGQIYYQSVINEPNPDDYCSRAKMDINANG